MRDFAAWNTPLGPRTFVLFVWPPYADSTLNFTQPMPIIHSLLDTDLYKFTMMQAVYHQFPAAQVEYRFHCRTPDVDLARVSEEITDEIGALCDLTLTEEELDYLGGLRYIKQDFVEFLRLFRLQRRFIEIEPEGDAFSLRIRGPWLHTILFEVPVLAIVSECFYRRRNAGLDLTEGRSRLKTKIETIRSLVGEPDYPPPAEHNSYRAAGSQPFVFSDFGTRRRFSREWQREVVAGFSRAVPDNFRGTSNVLLAKELNLIPIGTMAHEWVQATQALGPRLRDSQRFAFEAWAREYRGDLGTALSDTYSLDAFLRDFDMYFCKLFDGARQDSGDPFEWAERLIEHYRNNRVDPATRKLVFSDALTVDKAIAIYRRFSGHIGVSFGIGTHLTNDVGVDPINIVIKMTRCNDQPVAKLSDSPGKTMCDDETYLAWLRQAFDIPESPRGTVSA